MRGRCSLLPRWYYLHLCGTTQSQQRWISLPSSSAPFSSPPHFQLCCNMQSAPCEWAFEFFLWTAVCFSLFRLSQCVVHRLRWLESRGRNLLTQERLFETIMISYTKHMITLSLPVSFYAAHVLTPPSFERACMLAQQLSLSPLALLSSVKNSSYCRHCSQSSRKLFSWSNPRLCEIHPMSEESEFTQPMDHFYSDLEKLYTPYNPVRKLEESRDCLPDVFSVPSGNLFASPLLFLFLLSLPRDRLMPGSQLDRKKSMKRLHKKIPHSCWVAYSLSYIPLPQIKTLPRLFCY